MGILGNFRDSARGALENAVGYTNASDRRAQATMMNDQIKAYRDQTELARQETEAKRNELAVEKRRVERKQIRALRGSYSSRGLMSAPAPAANMTDKLGG